MRIAEMMKALRKTGPGQGAELVRVPVPALRPGHVLVKVELAAICGSDQAVYRWSPGAASRSSPPFTMGHEYCGTVVAVDGAVKTLKVGDRVAGETHYPCGKCYICRGENRHICVDMKNIGKSYEGCFADYILVPEECAIRVADSLDPRIGAVLEPLGVAVHALQKTNPCGETVAVFGCGPIGLMAVAVAGKLGAHRVYAVGRTAAKLEMAKQLGAHAVFNARETSVVEAIRQVTGGPGVDIVIEASGSEEAFHQGLEVLKNLGRFCLLGIPPQPVQFDADRYLIRKELNITGIWGRRMYATWILVEQMIASGELDLAPLLGDIFPLDRYAAAFELAASGSVQRVFFAPG